MKLPIPATRAGRDFVKGHGHGNDYLVFPFGDDWVVDPESVRTVCHRTRGVGSDGIVVIRPPVDGRVPELRMFNPDGHPFERSGNGLRIAAAVMVEWGWMPARGPAQVRCWGVPVGLEVHGSMDGRTDVSVDLGRARISQAAVEFDPDRAGPLALDPYGPLDWTGVSVGNPHAVVWGVGGSDEVLHAVGPFVATHTGFAAGTNVQLAWIQDGQLHIRIWERGVGKTSASGTSASAATVSAVATGRLAPGAHVVHMDGGTFRVTVTEDLDVTLRGPVQRVMAGQLDPHLVGTSGTDARE